MDLLSTKALNYSSLSEEDKKSFITEISAEPSLAYDLLLSSSDCKFQEDLLKENLSKLKLVLSDDKIVGKLFRHEIFFALLFQKSSVLLSIDQIHFNFEGLCEEFTLLVLDRIHDFIGRETIGVLSSDGMYMSDDGKFQNVRISKKMDEHIHLDQPSAKIALSFFFEAKLVSYEIHPPTDAIHMKNPSVSRAVDAFVALGISYTALFSNPENPKIA